MVTYVGEQNFVQVTNPILDRDEWGLDRTSIKFKGPAPKLPAFLATLAQGQPCPEVPGLSLTSWSNDENGVYPTVTCVYKGLRDSDMRYSSTLDQSIQSVTRSVEGISGEYYKATRITTFLAPTRTHTYYSGAETINAVYTTVGSFLLGDLIIYSDVIKATHDVDGSPTEVTFYGSAPAAVASAMAYTALQASAQSHKSTPVTPLSLSLWHNEDVVIAKPFPNT